ncbi:MAG: permease-like cell division protein FtsX [Bacteroidales bacterium]|nr:permease-like cell division protein FtsX [Bacteroidales bacterium]MCF8456475.1 permease-like cell division protein FtsX [Bacteroidales bacterium]
MAKGGKDKTSKSFKNRLRSSYFTTILSISLVLFLIGLMGLLLLNSQRLSDYVKENIGFSVILKDNIKEVDIIRLQKELDATHYIKSTEYIPKERAAREFSEELGEDFVTFLDYNPLLASIEVKLYAGYANPDSIAVIEGSFQDYAQVKEVYYQKNLVHLINDNLKRISFYIFIFSLLLLLIAVVLINNTIRLSVYSKRFIINTMQLVGATNSFIRRPFMYNSIFQGLLGAAIAILLLLGLIDVAQKELSGVISFKEYELLSILFAIVVAVGIVLTGISAWFAVNKYLRMKADELYY